MYLYNRYISKYPISVYGYYTTDCWLGKSFTLKYFDHDVTKGSNCEHDATDILLLKPDHLRSLQCGEG